MLDIDIIITIIVLWISIVVLGLDPAKPLYDDSDPKDRLYITDGLFVDVIHTDGKTNGIYKPIGDIDFYPNGGRKQPTCGLSGQTFV